MKNSTYTISKNADGSFKISGKGAPGFEVLSKSFPAKVGDKFKITIYYANHKEFELFNNVGLQFGVSDVYKENADLTSKIVLPNTVTPLTEYQLEYTATSSNVWMLLNLGGVADISLVDFDIKIEVENLTNPVKYAYIGTYTGKIVDGQSTDPVKYNWKENN